MYYQMLLILVALTCRKVHSDPARFYLDTRQDAYVFQTDIPIKFIVHGWTEDGNRTHYINLAKVLLKVCDCYVYRVDYAEIARKNYLISANQASEVGKFVGDFIINITRKFDISLSNVHVIGHSLGGQVSGYIGRRVIEKTGRKIYRITALDPASPLFELNPDAYKLTRNDADIVDIIHTDAGVLGYARSLGHVDFYPNGGKRLQPECEFMNDFYCSHRRSYQFFTASILNKYMATKCTSWDSFNNGQCDNNAQTVFGYYMPENAAGSYFLDLDVGDEFYNDAMLANA